MFRRANEREDPADELTKRQERLLDDLSKEYYALVNAVAGVDGRLMTVKGWSVTLSLAALGIGFQQQHYALFGLGAATAAAFWFLDGLMKGHQMRHYPRMRDIEVATYELNHCKLDRGEESSPQIDSAWNYPLGWRDRVWNDEKPQRRDIKKVRRLRRSRFMLPNVVFPHLAAVLLGGWLFLAAYHDWWSAIADLPL